jgi:hypothetical protein
MGKPERKGPFGRSKRRWKDTKMEVKETGCESADLINVAQDRDKRRDLTNTVTNLRVP